jgi:hypothetical protein
MAGSDAQRLLKEGVDQGMHLQLAPKELRETRAEYKLFDPRVFQKHIYQEKHSRKDYDEATKAKRYQNSRLGNKEYSRTTAGEHSSNSETV